MTHVDTLLAVDLANVNSIDGSKGGGCFVAGTPIAVRNGQKPIEDIRIGDLVWSFDQAGELSLKAVREVFIHKDKEIWRYEFWGGLVLEATPNHWVVNQYGAFAEIGTLTEEDAIVDHRGHLRPLVSKETLGLGTVHNFVVEGNHTYVANFLRVHNGGRGEAIVGAKGGGGKGGGGAAPRPAQEDPNTLRSKSIARLIDILGDGEIVGLVNPQTGAKLASHELGRAIFLDDTPIIDETGSANFKGVTIAERIGSVDQPHVSGFPSVETPHGVGVEVKFGIPAIRAIPAPGYDAARVIVGIPALYKQNKSNGDMHGWEVGIRISVRADGGAWVPVVTEIIKGKCTSPYQRQYRVELPDGYTAADIMVERTTADAADSSMSGTTNFDSMMLLQDAKLSYPGTTYIALTVDAEQFGMQIPTRSYEIKGRVVRVPNNYNPVTRTYTGLWNGQFATAKQWTDNPAWVLYDILTDRESGLGEFIDTSQVDKWSLYEIAQYCDQLVPDGLGGQRPRYAFNGVINKRTDAYQVIQAICSNFRGISFWSSGAVYAVADKPSDPVKLVTPANVIGGNFSYSSTGRKARHSVAMVTWNDPADGYKQAIEVVEDPELLRKYGWRPVEIIAFGCTNRAQAHTAGLWVLDSEKNETQVVTYTASFDHANARPGEIIAIADPSYANVRFGGRLKAISGTSVTLDAPVTLASGHSYTLSVMLPDGTKEDRAVTSAAGEHAALTIASTFSQTPAPGAVWVLSGTDLKPRLFSVRAVANTEKNAYKVTAAQHDPTKYARIENGVKLDPLPYTRPSVNAVPAPTNLTHTESTYWINGLPRTRLTVSWTAPASAEVVAFDVEILHPGHTWTPYTTIASNTVDINDLGAGAHQVRVRSAHGDGRRSEWVTTPVITIAGKNFPPGPPSSVVAEGSYRSITVKWVRPADTDIAHFEVLEAAVDDKSVAVKVGEIRGTQFVRGGLGGLVTRYYWVRAVDLTGNVGPLNSDAGTPATTHQISHDDLADQIIDSSKLVPDLAKPIQDAVRINYAERIDELSAAILNLSDAAYARFEDIVSQRVDFAASSAYIETRLTTLAADDAALAQRVDALEVQVGDDLQAAILNEQKARIAGDDALAGSLTTLSARVDDNNAMILDEQTARANGDSANATSINQLAASRNRTFYQTTAPTASAVGDIWYDTDDNNKPYRWSGSAWQAVRDGEISVVAASVTTEQNARISGDNALASDISTLTTTVNGNTASIQTHATSINGLNAKYTVKVDVNGYVAGFGLAVDANTATPTSEFIIRADKFAVIQPGYARQVPFVIADGRVSIDTAFINSLSANKVRTGVIVNNAGNAGLNLDATGSSNFLYTPNNAARITADGKAYFTEGSISGNFTVGGNLSSDTMVHVYGYAMFGGTVFSGFTYIRITGSGVTATENLALPSDSKYVLLDPRFYYVARRINGYLYSHGFATKTIGILQAYVGGSWRNVVAWWNTIEDIPNGAYDSVVKAKEVPQSQVTYLRGTNGLDGPIVFSGAAYLRVLMRWTTTPPGPLLGSWCNMLKNQEDLTIPDYVSAYDPNSLINLQYAQGPTGQWIPGWACGNGISFKLLRVSDQGFGSGGWSWGIAGGN